MNIAKAILLGLVAIVVGALAYRHRRTIKAKAKVIYTGAKEWFVNEPKTEVKRAEVVEVL
jgi:hypothetical protein